MNLKWAMIKMVMLAIGIRYRHPILFFHPKDEAVTRLVSDYKPEFNTFYRQVVGIWKTT